MIEINLLEEKQQFRLPVVMGMDLNEINFKAVIAGVIIMSVLEFYHTQYWEKKITESNQILATTTTKLNTLNKEVQGNETIKMKLDAYNLQVDKLKERSKQVEQIINARTNPKQILEKIARSIPEDIWLKTLKIDKDSKILIEGSAGTYTSIGEFVQRANESTYFGKTLSLVSSKTEQESSDNENRIENFNLQGTIMVYGGY